MIPIRGFVLSFSGFLFLCSFGPHGISPDPHSIGEAGHPGGHGLLEIRPVENGIQHLFQFPAGLRQNLENFIPYS